MPYSLTLPSGFVATEIPDNLSQQEALMLLRRNLPQEFPAPEEAPFTKGLKSFGTTVGTGLEALVSPESARPEIARRALLEQQDIGARYTGGADFSKVKDVFEKKGLFPALGEVGSQIIPATQEQIPFLASTGLGAIAGRSIAGALAGIKKGRYFGPKTALLLGTAGLLTPSFFLNLGAEAEREAQQKLEKGQPLDFDPAYATALAQAGSEFALLIPKFGRKIFADILGPEAKKLFEVKDKAKELKRLEGIAKNRLTSEAFKGLLKGAGAEGATEVAQAMLSRNNLGLNLLDDEAMSEYMDSLYGAALVGGPLGGAGSVYQKATARTDANKVRQQLARDKAEVAEKAERVEEDITKDEPLQLGYQPKPEDVYGDPVFVQDVEEENPVQNFLGNVNADGLDNQTKNQINKKRRELGRPNISSYSMEDVFEALEPEQYDTELDKIIAAKLQEKNIDLNRKISFEQIENLADEMGITAGGDVFNSLIRRTIGSDVFARGEPIEGRGITNIKRIAIFEALQNVGNNPGAVFSTNATRFSDKQYEQGLNGLRNILRLNNKNSISKEEAIKEIKDFTKLENDADAESILRTARERGDLQERTKPAFEVVRTLKKGTQTTQFDTRKQAEKAAKNDPKAQVREVLKTSFNFSNEVPSDLPDGSTIEPVDFPEGQRVEGAKIGEEAPTDFEVTVEGKKLKGGKKFKTFEEAQKYEAQVNDTRARKAKRIAKEIEDKNKTIESKKASLLNQDVLTEDEVRPDASEQQLKVKDEIARLRKEIDDKSKDLEKLKRSTKITSTAKKRRNVRQGFGVRRPDGQLEGPFETKEQAEQYALRNQDNLELQKNIDLDNLNKEGELERASREEINRRTGLDLETKEDVRNAVNLNEKQKAEIKTKLEKVLKKVGLEKVAVNIMNQLDGNFLAEGINGAYAKRIIHIALTAPNPMQTMKHEVIHALKEFGAFTDSQWKALTKKADEVWIDKYLSKGQIERYKREYGDDTDAIREEAIAEAFAEYDRVLFEGDKGGQKPFGGIRSIVERLKSFFEAIKNAFNGIGFTSSDQIFSGIVRGEFAESIRDPESASEQAFFQLEKDKNPKVLTDEQIVERLNELVERVNKRISKDDSKFTLQKVQKASAKLQKFLNQGIKGKDWYENSAKEVLKAFDNDPVLTDKFFQVLAMTSPQAEVVDNVGAAVKAWNQWAKGEPVRVKTKAQNKAIQDFLDYGLPFGGRKTNTFYRNFMEAVEEVRGKDSTIDLHMARMLFDKDAPSSAEFDLAEGLVDLQSDLTGLPPRKIQAATWVRQKTYSIFKEFIEKGYHKNKSRKEKLRIAMERALVDYGTILANDNLIVSEKFKEPTNELLARTEAVTGEIFPSTKLKVNKFGPLFNRPLYEQLYNLSISEKKKLNESLLPTVERIKDILGIESDLRVDIGQGLYEGAINPNFIIRIKNDKDKDQATRDAEDFSRAMAYVFKQDAVPFLRPVVNIGDRDALGFVFNLKENVDGAPGYSANQFAEKLKQATGSDIGFTLTRPNQLAVINFGDIQGQMAGSDITFATKMLDFYNSIQDQVFGRPEIFGFKSTYNVDDPNFDRGGSYNHAGQRDRDVIISRLQESRPSRQDIRERLDDVFSEFTEIARSAVESKQAKLKRPTERGVRFQFAPVETEPFKQWFGDSKIVNPDGSPKVMYHGTSANFSTFKPKQAKSVFVSDDPSFAEIFAKRSQNYMIENAEKFINQADIENAISMFVEKYNSQVKPIIGTKIKKSNLIQRYFKFVEEGEDKPIPKLGDYIAGRKDDMEGEQLFYSTLAEFLPSNMNVMPLYVSAKNPFDYENPENVQRVVNQLISSKRINAEEAGSIENMLLKGFWDEIESNQTQLTLKELGFDSYYVKEGGVKNLAVYNTTQLKSASGNMGTYSKDNADIRYQFTDSMFRNPKEADQQEKIPELQDAIIARAASGLDAVGRTGNKEAIKKLEQIIYQNEKTRIRNYKFVPNPTTEQEMNIGLAVNKKPKIMSSEGTREAIVSEERPSRITFDYDRQGSARITPSDVRQAKSIYREELQSFNDEFKPKRNIDDNIVKTAIAFAKEDFYRLDEDLAIEFETASNRAIDNLNKKLKQIGANKELQNEVADLYSRLSDDYSTRLRNYDRLDLQERVSGFNPIEGKKQVIEAGTVISIRQDVPFFLRTGKMALTAHEPTESVAQGKVIGYLPTSKLSGHPDGGKVKFIIDEAIEQAAFDIGSGKTGKRPFATYNGKFIPRTTEENYAEAVEIMKNNFDLDGNPKDESKWVQVAFNPRRHSYFYTRHNQKPVISADEVIQVENLILAKNPKLGQKSNFKYQFEAEVEERLGKDTVERINKTISTVKEQELAKTVVSVTSPEGIDSIFGRFRQAFINQYEGIERLMNIAAKNLPEGFDVLRGEVNALASAVFSDFGAAVSSEAFKRGVPVLDGGITLVESVDKDGKKIHKGLMEVLEPLMARDDPDGYVFKAFQYYMSAKRSQELVAKEKARVAKVRKEIEIERARIESQFGTGPLTFEEAKRKKTLLANLPKDPKPQYTEKLFTPEDIKKADELAKTFPEFEQVRKDYQKFNRSLVKYLIDTGVLSKEMGESWMRDSFYIPFYRQMEGEETSGPRLLSGLAGQRLTPKIKGGEQKLDDFFLNVVQNTRAAIEAGLKNEAARKTISYAVRLNDPAMNVPYAMKVNKKFAGDNDVIRIREDGKDVYYRVADPLLLSSMQSFTTPHIPGIQILSKPATVLREMVTRDPGFMMANLFRDSFSAWFTSGAKGYTPIISSLKQLTQTAANMSPEAQLLMSAGVGTGYEFKANVLDTAEEVRRQMRERAGTLTGLDRAGQAPLALWRKLEKGTTLSDISTRAAVAEQVLKNGGSRADAVYQAIEIMNFNRKGSSPIIRILAASIPFLNARIQGLDVLYRVGMGKMATKNQAARHKAFLNRALFMIASSVLYYYLAKDEEEYQTAEDEQRDLNWIVGSAKLPVPFELGILFKTIPERLSAYFMGHQKADDLAESMTRNLISTFNFLPIPQVAKPLIEVTSNHSFFTGERIVGLGQEGIEERYQANNGTSLFARSIGENTGISPIQIDYLIRGYTGTLGSYAVMLLDSIFRGQGDPIKPTFNPEQMPVLKRFFASPESTKPKTDFFKLRVELDKAVSTINHLERTGKTNELLEYLNEKQPLIDLAPYIRQLDKDLKSLRSEKNFILESPSMAPELKQQTLNAIRTAEMNLLSNINQFKSYLR